MVLDVTVSRDDRFIVTCDRDEKIRVSLSRSPYNIQSFCLGHQQFVSALLSPSGGPHTLLSGSGDGTVCVWDMETGRRLQTVDLREQCRPTEEERLTVSRLCSSPDGGHVAVLCERLKEIQLLSLEQTEGGAVLSPHSHLPLSHCPLDLSFDPSGRLWVLLNCAESPLLVYGHAQGSWEQLDALSPDLSRVSPAFKTFWDAADESQRSSSRLEHLYVETYDNVSEYMKKKQQRLEQQSHKRSREHSREPKQTNKPKKTKAEANGS
uniref:WD repeat domain 4 n=1 Tax=Neogobius melanostomus TaxID=47308 RepID=A0A8C6TF82_9GOBI